MTADLLLAAGVILGILSVPAMVSAFVNERPPRRAAIALMIAIGLVVLAGLLKPEGVSLEGVARSFARLIAAIIH